MFHCVAEERRLSDRLVAELRSIIGCSHHQRQHHECGDFDIGDDVIGDFRLGTKLDIPVLPCHFMPIDKHFNSGWVNAHRHGWGGSSPVDSPFYCHLVYFGSGT